MRLDPKKLNTIVAVGLGCTMLNCEQLDARPGGPGPGGQPSEEQLCMPGEPSALIQASGFTVEGDSRTRTYLMYIPTCKTATLRRPVVIFIHGLCGEASQQDAITGLTKLAEQEEFNLVYAESGSKNGFGVSCPGMAVPKWWGVGTQAEAELPYFDAILAQLKAYPVDMKRVYAFGHSNGGHMIYQLAQNRASDYAAFASFAGGPGFLGDVYQPSRKVPFAIIQGADDKIVNPSVTMDVRDEVVAFNQANPVSQQYSIASGDGWDELLYGQSVLWAFLEGRGHLLWSSSTSSEVPAPLPTGHNINQVVWDFVKSNHL